jgi:hypothetical protein
MDTPVVVAVALIAAIVGVVLGFIVRTVWASQAIKAAQAEARQIEAEARARQKELILEAKDEKLRLQREAEDEARAKRTELSALERRLLQRDEQLDQRAEILEARDRKLIDRERELERSREEVARAHQVQIEALERVAGMSAEEAKGVLLEAVREEAEHDAVRVAKAIERRAREEAGDRAREVIVTAMQRDQLWWAQGQLEALRNYCYNLVRLRNNFSDPEVGDEPYFKIDQAVPVDQLSPLQETFCRLEKAAMLKAGLRIVQVYRELAIPLAQAHGIAFPEALERILLLRLEELQKSTGLSA